MPIKPKNTVLNAKTIDILNVIRANATREYQQSIPAITTYEEIPKLGELICGAPAIQNEFLGALLNRIAMVNVKSATFYNAYAAFKKGEIAYGEVIEEVFTDIIKAHTFNVEKAGATLAKRNIPKAYSVFHVINFKRQYDLTVEHAQVRRAFLTPEGVSDFIAKLVGQIATANEYDEFLLMKYLIIKGCNNGGIKMIPFASNDMEKLLEEMRNASSQFTFMHRDYNLYGVLNTCPKERQAIIIDAKTEAVLDVEQLSSAFHMEKKITSVLVILSIHGKVSITIDFLKL